MFVRPRALNAVQLLFDNNNNNNNNGQWNKKNKIKNKSGSNTFPEFRTEYYTYYARFDGIIVCF